MPDATATISNIFSAYDDGSDLYHAFGTLTVGASPLTYATGGINFSLFNPLIKASRTPVNVLIKGIAGYDYSYVKGADGSAGKLMIRQSAAAGNPWSELTNGGAIPAGVSSDTITFQAYWKGPL